MEVVHQEPSFRIIQIPPDFREDGSEEGDEDRVLIVNEDGVIIDVSVSGSEPETNEEGGSTTKTFILSLNSDSFKYCPVCGKEASESPEVRMSHVNSCIGSKNFRVKIERKSTVVNSRTRQACSSCKKTFANKAAFEKHRFFCDPNVLLADYELVSSAFEEKNSNKESNNAGKSREKVSKAKTALTCPECNKTFCSVTYLKTHIRIHTGEKPFACQICDKSFNDRTALRNHNKSHTDERPFSCNLCPKSFRRSDSLKYHLASHTEDRPYICSSCAKSYKNERDLKFHERTHNNNSKSDELDELTESSSSQGQRHVCHDCSNTFNSYNSFKYHRRVAHNDGKTFDCGICGKKCVNNSQLEIHFRTHTGEKPFGCGLCGKAFRRHSHLVLHESRHTGTNNYVCKFCEKGFPQKVELVQHEKTHSGEKPYVCETCGKSFCRQDYLRAHLKVHNGEDKILTRKVSINEGEDYDQSTPYFEIEVPNGDDNLADPKFLKFSSQSGINNFQL